MLTSIQCITSSSAISRKTLQSSKHVFDNVDALYLHLNIEQYETTREDKIVKQLELLKTELGPMEKVSIFI